MYALQARLLTARENARIESIWAGYIRKMVKGGYARKKSPHTATGQPEEEFNWAFKLTNAKLLSIAKTTSISAFIEKQHFKFIAHTTRRPNDHLQKMLCFAKPQSGRSHWTRLEKAAGIDQMQLRSTMFKRLDFNKWLELRYSHGPPRTSRRTSGKQ